MKRAVLALVCLTALLALPARGGTVYLFNDEEIEGEIVDVGVDYVVLKIGDGRQMIPLREVRDIEVREGESLWGQKVREALERVRRTRAPVAPTQEGSSSAAPTSEPAREERDTQAPPVIQALRNASGKIYESDPYEFIIRYPAAFDAAEPEPGFLTFKDTRGVIAWSFDVTFFDAIEDAEYDVIRQRTQDVLERLPSYHTRSRRPVSISRYTAERTTGTYERAGHSIRHDQLIVPTRRGVLLFEFFSPGATLEENGVPEVDAVIASLGLK